MSSVMRFGLLAVAVVFSLTALTAAGFGASHGNAPGLPPSSGGGGGCPSSNALGNFNQSSLVGVAVTKGSTSWSYYFSSLKNLNPTSGVPGLISYCVYAGSTSPTSISVSASGADGNLWTSTAKSTQGYHAFPRGHGDPSNIPLDGTMNILMGSASWTAGAPTNQTILLHINDATECAALYGGNPGTCFVYPGGSVTPPCGGAPACKTASITEATSTSPLTVPQKTVLHITWTFTISNALSNGFNMEFPLSTFPMASGNGTGLRDMFNCGEAPDSSGAPGALGWVPNYQGTGFDLYLNATGMPCSMERVVLTNSGSTIVLMPGQSITFTMNMVDPGFLVRGMHCLNYGINLRWVQSDDGLIHAYHAPDVDVLVN
ncbi:MAG TPA: hypothetical protein VFG07_02295 [Thermoplasmata archaeon]|nr:hypothetical protein [Thermoplasmata archaeon]